LLRDTLKARRRALDPELKAAWDQSIGARVLAWWQANPHASLPVVVARHAALEFAEWLPGEPTVADRMGVAVPAELRMVARPPALLVPCLGFNALGYRVGYGGGFYDRTLAPGPRPSTVGIAYACQLVEFVGDAHDVPLDRVITEA
jgi:5-formyltetrahydrofolate cyclo-ligase